MIVRKAKASEKHQIFQWWKEIFAYDDNGYTDFYFEHYYETADAYVIVTEEDLLVGALQVHTKNLKMNQKLIKTAFIVGIFILPKYRHQGHMHTLLNAVLESIDHTYLLTLIQSYVVDIYKPFGFDTLYYRRIFNLDAKSISTMSTNGVSYTSRCEDLLKLYNLFTSVFNAYAVRSLNDFNLLVSEVSAQQGKIITYSEDNQLRAYAILYAHSNHIEIDEMVYLDTKALLTILSTLANSKDRIILKASYYEDLSRIFPNAHSEIEPYTSLRINNLDLWNACFKVTTHNQTEAFHSILKHVWIRESQ